MSAALGISIQSTSRAYPYTQQSGICDVLPPWCWGPALSGVALPVHLAPLSHLSWFGASSCITETSFLIFLLLTAHLRPTHISSDDAYQTRPLLHRLAMCTVHSLHCEHELPSLCPGSQPFLQFGSQKLDLKCLELLYCWPLPHSMWLPGVLVILMVVY